MERVLQSS